MHLTSRQSDGLIYVKKYGSNTKFRIFKKNKEGSPKERECVANKWRTHEKDSSTLGAQKKIAWQNLEVRETTKQFA